MTQMFTFPTNWAISTFDEIGIINPKSFDYQISDETIISFLPMKCVSEMSGILDLSIIKPYLEIKKGYSKFQNGDLLFAKITPCMENGKITIAKNLVNNVGCGTTEFHIIRFYSKINAELYRHFFLQDKIRKDAHRKMTGTAGQLRVPISFVKELSIPLPPLNEQHRIVAKIEELFTQLDAGIASLQAAQVKIGQYRKAVLKHAFEGKLTEAWRESHKDEIEPASVLLERIREGRRKDKKYKELPPVNTEGLPELPEGWVWVKSKEICENITNGYTPKSDKMYQNEGEIPFIKVYNLTFDGSLNFNKNPTFIDKSTHDSVLTRSRIFPGDILMNIVGPPLGKVSIVPNLYPEWNINQAIVFFRPLSGIESKYLAYSLQSDHNLAPLVKKARATAGQYNISVNMCRDMNLPLAPLEEQRTIVHLIERELSLIDNIERIITSSLHHGDSLRQSILKRAFEGRLVPQDPSDEPASVLLEKIRQEKITREPKKRGRKNKGT